MSNRRPQPERKPPDPRMAGKPEEQEEERQLIEQIVLPGLQLLAEELNADPALTAQAEPGTGYGSTAILRVERTLRDASTRVDFRCDVYPNRMPYAILAAARIAPTIENGRYLRKSRDVPSLTFGPKRSHLSVEVTPEQVRDAVRAEYERTATALRDAGLAPPKEGQ